MGGRNEEEDDWGKKKNLAFLPSRLFSPNDEFFYPTIPIRGTLVSTNDNSRTCTVVGMKNIILVHLEK